MDLTLQRGFIPVDLDRTRILAFDMQATWMLVQRFGPKFLLELYRVKDGNSFELVSMEALTYFLWVGLQADARKHGEELTLEQAAEFLRPWTYTALFHSVVFAVVGATAAPPLPGKAPADGQAAAKPAAGTKHAAAKNGPGPSRASTLMKRSASASRSSAGRRRSSGR